jgi:lysophospholipase L1-like esterase
MKSRAARPAAVVLAIALTPSWSCAHRMAVAWNGRHHGNGGGRARTAFVHTIGRFDERDAAGSRLSWPGTAVEATFTGVGLEVRLRDAGANFFTAVIDGGPPQAFATSGATEQYALASNLTPGPHTVVLTKLTESNVGVVQFLGFAPRGGVLVATPESPPRRRIEFIGDSITCGYGDRTTDPRQHFSPETEDESIAYGGLTAAALGAQRSVVAYSGIGMFRSFAGSTVDQMPERFRRSLADDPTSAWAFTSQPDVVVINLGANDFAKGDPGAPFQRAYVDFLRTLRGSYPAATIVCTLGSTLTDGFPDTAMSRTRAAAYIQAAVDERRRAGDARVAYFAFSERRASDGFGADYHPSAETHRRMAAELVAALRAQMGW